MSKEGTISRRDFLKWAGVSLAGVAMMRFPFEDISTERVDGPEIDVPFEVRLWGMVGPEQMISKIEIETYVKPSLIKLIGYIPKAVGSEYCLVNDSLVKPLTALVEEAWKENLRFWINCGFRDLDWQAQAYDKSKTNGVASGYVSPPGRSQHQTGLAIDFQSLDKRPFKGNGFEGTKEGVWLDKNAHRFGFVRSFLGGVNPVLPTPEESWHYMFVGVDIAEEHYRRRMIDPDLEYYAFMKEMLMIKKTQEDMQNSGC